MLDRAHVREVYTEAAALPEEERPAFLARRCAGDAALRAEVESLLAAAARRPGFLASPTASAALAEAPGTRIGPYRLLEEIGQGGFGSVYMAEQEQPVRRRVALKIIKLGMDTRAVIARFEAERQALALMDHANIAKVFDAGATESGRPYFVMELVKGEPITTYCDKNNLSIPERLSLFVQVCQAVQHAHGKGVIHRDIKPGNVIVATEDGRPHAKVIDFGIAKATDHRLTERTLFTEFRQFVGTPEYMSPEQAEGSLNVDTRSDIYSLGVLLYQLLTGATPFDPEALRSAAYAEIQRIICEVEPPKPSTRLSQSAALAEVASRRRTEPARLSAQVRGDLDWIVMKALDKDRARRYDTASALAADVGRHLAGEPVAAAPPSRAYLARKFVRRNRGLVVGASLVAAALILGIAGTGVGLVLATLARADEAEQRRAALASATRAEDEARRAAAAEARALERAADLERVAEFQASQLKDIDPQRMGARLRESLIDEAGAWLAQAEPDEARRAARLACLGDELAGANFTTIALDSLQRNIFDRAIEAIDREFATQPLLRARLLGTVGETMRTLGLHEAAAGPQTRAWEIFRTQLGEEHPHTLEARGELGHTYVEWGRVPEAGVHLRAVLAAQERLLGEDDAARVKTMGNVASLLIAEGEPAEAERLARDVLERRERLLGEEDPQTLAALGTLALALDAQGRNAEAEPLERRGLELSRRVQGEEHPRTLVWLNNVAECLEEQGKFEEAAPYQEELLEKMRRVLGAHHPNVLTLLNNLGVGRVRRNRPAEAEGYFREVLPRMRLVLGETHSTTLMVSNNLGHVLRVQGRAQEAAAVLGEGVAAAAAGPPQTPVRAKLLHHYADALLALGRAEQARPLAAEALEIYHTHPDWDPQETRHAEQVLCAVLGALGEHTQAEALLRAAVDRARAAAAPASEAGRAAGEASLASALLALGQNLIAQERFAAAEPLLRECLEIRQRIFPNDHPNVWLGHNTRSVLGEAVAGQARDESLDTAARLAKLREAEPILLEGYNGMKDDPRVPSPALTGGADRKQEARLRIVTLYETWEEVEPGAGFAEKAAQWRGRSGDPLP